MKTGNSKLKATVLAAALAALALPALAQGPDLVLEFTNLEPLDASMEVYEGWAIVAGAPVSTGVFNVNAAGLPIDPMSGQVIDMFSPAADITGATDIKISIEPADDADPAPSGLIILGGLLDGTSADLTTGLESVADAGGCFILATPSDNAMDDMNDNQGIWWLQMPGPVAGLTGLPALGAGWTYEGWVVDTSGGAPMPYSTGTFAMADGFDSDMAGPMGGGPAFPGQDFVAYQGGPVLDLASGDFAAVISIEPVPDNSPMPFQLKPLAGMIAQGAGDGCVDNQTMATFPSGHAELMSSVATEVSSWSGVKAVFE
jgi:hypothetical protein